MFNFDDRWLTRNIIYKTQELYPLKSMTYKTYFNISVIVWLICMLLAAGSAEAAGFAVARTATPVLNSPEFYSIFGGRDGKALKTDSCGQVRELEFIATSGTAFKLTGQLEKGGTTVYRVVTDDYPVSADTPLYVDSRFLKLRDQQPEPRKRNLPSRQKIVAAMRSAAGQPYVWGGNVRSGVPELLAYYYRKPLEPGRIKRLTLGGLDCSGLLYEATGGWTPRNTSWLVHYGGAVAVSGRNAAEIAGLVEPLDLIVWKGHVLIVLDREQVIESVLKCGAAGHGGVVISPLKQRLAAIMKTRKPADQWPAGKGKRDIFVVRRWYPE